LVLIAIVGDFDAPHELHHKEWSTSFGGSGIQHLGNVWMIHQRQRLTLGVEAGYDLLGVHAQLDHFQGDFAADGLFLFRHVNHTATTFANLLEQLVSANAPTDLLNG
jgi:hypothetical protein